MSTFPAVAFSSQSDHNSTTTSRVSSRTSSPSSSPRSSLHQEAAPPRSIFGLARSFFSTFAASTSAWLESIERDATRKIIRLDERLLEAEIEKNLEIVAFNNEHGYGIALLQAELKQCKSNLDKARNEYAFTQDRKALEDCEKCEALYNEKKAGFDRAREPLRLIESKYAWIEEARREGETLRVEGFDCQGIKLSYQVKETSSF